MSSASVNKREKKQELIKKIYEQLSKYKQVVLVALKNVSSSQVQAIRKKLGKKNSILIIGKNTVIKKAIALRQGQLPDDIEDSDFYNKFGNAIPHLNILADLVKEKVGLILSDEPVFELMPIIMGDRVDTTAKAGVIAPVDVVVAPGPTGLDPSQINFFHALHISTKINKAQIEILKEVKVCEKGKAVGTSEAALLKKLGYKPFQYGMEVVSVYDDGSVLSSDIISLSPNDILGNFSKGVNNIAALSMELGIPTEAAVPHLVVNAFKNLVGISMVTDYKIKALESMASNNAPKAADKPKEEAKPAAKEEKPKEEEIDADMGDLFGGF